MTDISHRFALDEIDHRDLLEIFTLRYQTCWRVGKGQIAFPATKDHKLRLEMRHGQIARIWAGQSLSGQELDELLEQVEADLKDNRVAQFGAAILFAHRPVKGGFRFKPIQMQILPPPSDAPLPQQMLAKHPFVLEYPIQAFRTPELRNKQRQRDFPVDEFFVPDNLDLLIAAFLELDGENRRRFLRSAAAVYIAQDLWEVSISSFLLSCVQAVE